MNYNGGSICSSLLLYWQGHGAGYVLYGTLLLPEAIPDLVCLQLLAYALAHMAGIGGYDGWRWIFIIEGLATFVLAVVSRFFIVDWPKTAKFLGPEERQLLIRRLSEDVADARMDRLDGKAGRRAFGDWKIYIG